MEQVVPCSGVVRNAKVPCLKKNMGTLPHSMHVSSFSSTSFFCCCSHRQCRPPLSVVPLVFSFLAASASFDRHAKEATSPSLGWLSPSTSSRHARWCLDLLRRRIFWDREVHREVVQ
jgi:hypothetical protein